MFISPILTFFQKFLNIGAVLDTAGAVAPDVKKVVKDTMMDHRDSIGALFPFFKNRSGEQEF